MKIKNAAFFALASITASASPAFASDFDIRVSPDDVHLNYNYYESDSVLLLGGGYFFKDEDNEPNVNMTNINVMASDRTAMANMPTTISLGMELSYADHGNRFEGGGAGLGGSVIVNLPDAPGLSVEAQAFYAPKILAMEDAESFRRAHFQVNYRIIRNADVSAGYRYINAELKDDKDITFESGGYLGLRISF